MKDDDRPGRPRTAVTDDNIEKVRDVTRKDRSLGVRAVAEEVNLDRERVRRILRKELNVRKVCAKLIPKLLSPGQCASPQCTVCEAIFSNKNIAVLEHPPYSPDLAHCDFYLFPKIKSVLKGNHFVSAEYVKAKTAETLNNFTEHDLQNCFASYTAVC